MIEKTYRYKIGLANRGSTSVIILHHAAASTTTPDQIHSWHIAAGYAGIGYHFVVMKNGNIYRGRPENTVGAHALGHNGNSIGICFEGNFETETMCDAQKKAGQKLLTCLKNKYGNLAVKKHKDVNATACPGKNFPFEQITGGSSSGGSSRSGSSESSSTSSLLRQGSPGEEVKKLQTLLNYYGYDCGRIDGIFGADTKSAVLSFQKANGLSADGVVGPLTWAKINSTPTYASSGYSRLLKCTTPTMSGKDIRKVQTRLTHQGFNCGTIDGIYGIKTESAVKAFQQSVKISVDGQVGPVTWNKLF